MTFEPRHDPEADSSRSDSPGRLKSLLEHIPFQGKNSRALLGVVAALLVGALAWLLLRDVILPTSSTKGGGGPVQPVKIATARIGEIKVFVSGLGSVTPIATVNVVTQINGVLTEVGFREGQLVKKGDFLAQIDPRPYEVLQAQYEGQLLRDQGLLDQARIDLARYQTLLKQNSIARQTEEDQVYLVKQYEGSVKTDRALIDAQKLNLIYCHIVSPVDARVGLRLVDPGNYVQVGGTNASIAVLTQLQPITVIFPVPEDDLPEIMPQVDAGVPMKVEIYDRANINKLAEGELLTADNEIDTTTGMVKLRARFDNRNNKLFPNQFVNAHLLTRTLHDVVVIPTAAVQRGAPGAYAYVVDADNKARVHVLSLGPTEGDLVQAASGLSVGDRVVVDGADRLRDGSPVKIPEAAVPGAGQSRGEEQRQPKAKAR
ncbi:efflux RND transporter periplasmic adaptor subunit [Methylocystis heyeri]|uniref:Efflux RND transporter periplasmic adaptor subunit n=1 Tax=Methylocystis heyeri TaxID=391905 RepID=A0A6B8KGF8_9HYPH|nr:efflux RND transporter periplasmic adaptor subunit [Methylocystis heyeri]QGM45510.1 efflux RND transporter periplasmic adaptor subunit [Methylocystis heyeri]